MRAALQAELGPTMGAANQNEEVKRVQKFAKDPGYYRDRIQSEQIVP